jgi:hypothetical protein
MTETPLADLKVTTISQDEFDGKKAKPASKPSASAPRKTPLPPWKDGVIRDFMTGLYDSAGDLIMPFNEPYGHVFKAIAENCGQAWEDAAKDTPWLRRWIYSLMQASKLSKLLMAHMPLMIVALHQHGPLRQATDDLAEQFANGFNPAAA